MGKIIPVLFILVAGSVFAETNNSFTFVPQKGAIITLYNNSPIQNIKEIKNIFNNLEDRTCIKLYQNSRTKHVFGLTFSGLGGALMGFSIMDGTQEKSPIFSKTQNRIIFISGIISAFVGLLLEGSSYKDMVKSFEYYNNHSISVSLQGIQSQYRF